MTEINRHNFANPQAMAQQVSADVGAIIANALAARGSALLALSGGSSPFPIYERLAKSDLDWARVSIFTVDERFVDSESPLSNIAALKQAFLATQASVLPLFDNIDDLSSAASQANNRLQSLDWPPDLVWLGMGTDGHFASIFPGPDFDTALSPMDGAKAISVHPDPLPADAPVPRISLTAPAIADARHLILTIAGEAKKAVLDHAMELGEASVTPIGRFMASLKRPISIYWTEN